MTAGRGPGEQEKEEVQDPATDQPSAARPRTQAGKAGKRAAKASTRRNKRRTDGGTAVGLNEEQEAGAGTDPKEVGDEVGSSGGDGGSRPEQGSVERTDATASTYPHVRLPAPVVESGHDEATDGHDEDRSFSIVTIDRDDDIPSICGKIETARCVRVALVSPRGNVIMEREALGARLVRRHAEQTGREIAIVTPRRKLAARARSEGIPVRASLDGRPVGAVRITVGRRPVDVPVARVLRTGTLAVTALAAVLVVTFAFFPSATVTVYPSTRSVTQPFQVVASPAVERVDLEEGVIPAQRIRARVTYTFVVPTSGKVSEGASRARGAVLFINKTDKPRSIPAGTVVATKNGVQFVTTQVAELPGGADQSVGVGILAAEPGKSGNVGPGTITTVGGISAEEVAVANLEPTTGGTDREVGAVVEADVERVRAETAGVITHVGWQQLVKEYEGRGIVPKEAVDVFITRDEFDANVGDVADFLTLRVEATVAGLLVPNASLEEAAAGVLAPLIDEGSMLAPGSVTARVVGNPSFDRGDERLSLDLVAAGEAMDRVDVGALRSDLAGSRPGSVVERVNRTIDSRREPVLDLEPEWMPTLPWYTGRVSVVFKTGEE